MNKTYRFCDRTISFVDGIIDIGGLKLCSNCYETRSARTTLPCTICNKDSPIPLNSPLYLSTICWSCEEKVDLSKAYHGAYHDKKPCDKCGRITEYHQATVYGQNLCKDCYKASGSYCTQCYPGDRGYAPFPTKPSVPAILLQSDYGVLECVVCHSMIIDPLDLVSKYNLPTICQECDGSKWWDAMNRFRKKEKQ